MIRFLILSFVLFLPFHAEAKPKVVTTTTTLKSVVSAIAGERAKVESITKGSQDPHFLEPKPSYILKLRGADLIVSVGLDLEIGWLPNIIRGARNPNILPGKEANLELGPLIDPIEIPQGKVDRAHGDVHPFGNPHFYLDPIRIKKAAEAISKRLSAIDEEGKSVYRKNLKRFTAMLEQRTETWKKRIQASGVQKVVTYHKTFNYFLDRFGLKVLGTIEPKPGIPPTAKHIIGLIEKMKAEKVSCILVESFFELDAAHRIQKDVPSRISHTATEVQALADVNNYVELIDQIVSAVESCAKLKQNK